MTPDHRHLPPPPGYRQAAPVSPLALGVIVAAAILMLAAFLPWVALSRDTGGLFGGGGSTVRLTGIKADGTAALALVCAATAIGLTVVSLVKQRWWLMLYAAVAGGVAALGCFIFVVRVVMGAGQVQQEWIGLLDLSLTPSWGWMLALLASAAVLGLSIADFHRRRPR